MAWHDWINPDEVSQLSQLSQSQTQECENHEVSHGHKTVSLLTPLFTPFAPQNASPERPATVTVATPAAVAGNVVPLVVCRDCHHFRPDPINPPAGLGRCRIGAEGDRLPWPRLMRRCESFQASPEALKRFCQDACAGLSLDPARLYEWVVSKGEPMWTNPQAVTRLAHLIEQQGGFPSE